MLILFDEMKTSAELLRMIFILRMSMIRQEFIGSLYPVHVLSVDMVFSLLSLTGNLIDTRDATNTMTISSSYF